MIEVESASLSDQGPNRDNNEDAHASCTPGDSLLRERKGLLYLVADGVGGHNAGEVASATAVEAAQQEYYAPTSNSRVERALGQAVQAANMRIHVLGMQNSAYSGMETTLTAVALAGSHAYVAHVGDSRVYHWRAGVLRKLTNDHSEVAELVKMRILSPEKARVHPRRNVLTRTVGHQLILRPDFVRQPMQEGDCLLMCTDGLWTEIEDGEMAEVLAGTPPAEAVRRLIDMALERQCGDNVTVQVVRVTHVDEEPPATGGARNGWLSGIFSRRGAP